MDEHAFPPTGFAVDRLGCSLHLSLWESASRDFRQYTRKENKYIDLPFIQGTVTYSPLMYLKIIRTDRASIREFYTALKRTAFICLTFYNLFMVSKLVWLFSFEVHKKHINSYVPEFYIFSLICCSRMMPLSD